MCRDGASCGAIGSAAVPLGTAPDSADAKCRAACDSQSVQQRLCRGCAVAAPWLRVAQRVRSERVPRAGPQRLLLSPSQHEFDTVQYHSRDDCGTVLRASFGSARDFTSEAEVLKSLT